MLVAYAVVFSEGMETITCGYAASREAFAADLDLGEILPSAEADKLWTTLEREPDAYYHDETVSIHATRLPGTSARKETSFCRK